MQTFTLSRGLRQGDPLSPYLFLICAEGFSTLVNQAELKRDIRGAKVARGGTSVTHLLFADGFILFYGATRQEWMKLQDILTAYEKGLGQVLNKQKSSIFFSPNTFEIFKQEVIQAAGGVTFGSYEN